MCDLLDCVGSVSIDTCAPVVALSLRGASPPQGDKFLGDEVVHDAVPYKQNRAFLSKRNQFLGSGFGAGFRDLN